MKENQVLTGNFLRSNAASATWFDFVLRHRYLRSSALALERMTLPGVVAHWLVRKLLLDQIARASVASGCDISRPSATKSVAFAASKLVSASNAVFAACQGKGDFLELARMGASGSRFAFTFMEERPGRALGFHAASPLIRGWLRWRSEPFRWGLPRAEVASFLAPLGWRLQRISSPEELRREFLIPRGLDRLPLAMGESVVVADLAK